MKPPALQTAETKQLEHTSAPNSSFLRLFLLTVIFPRSQHFCPIFNRSIQRSPPPAQQARSSDLFVGSAAPSPTLYSCSTPGQQLPSRPRCLPSFHHCTPHRASCDADGADDAVSHQHAHPPRLTETADACPASAILLGAETGPAERTPVRSLITKLKNGCL